MPVRPPHPTVLLLSSVSTLPTLGRRLGREGIRLVRVDAVVSSASSPGLLAQRLNRFGPYDTVALSSQAAVSAFVRPLWRRDWLREPEVEFWVVGPET
ncbi:MAG: hypothetical protein ACLQD8_04955, partial [Thermoplasmata archaeon]